MYPYYVIDASEQLDYEEDWTDFLGDDTISVSDWDVPPQLTLVNETNTATTARAFLAVPEEYTLGTWVRVVNRITSSSTPAREGARSVWLQIAKL